MRLNKTYSKPLALIVLIGALLCIASCNEIFEYPETAVESSEDSYLLFNISAPEASAETKAGNTSAETKAETDPGYDDGTEVNYENYVNLVGKNKFKIFIFDESDNILHIVDNANVFISSPDNLTSKTYRLTVRLNPDIFESHPSFKLAFLANFQIENNNIQKLSDISNSANLANSYAFGSYWKLGTNYIPMFGVTNLLTDKTPVKKTVVDVGTIHLLRAMAKVEVVSAPEEAEIEWVKVNRYYSGGICAPAGVSKQDDYYTESNSHALNYYHTLTLPDLAQYGINNGSKTFTALPSSDGGHNRNVIYLPEFRNVGVPEGERSYMTVKFVGDATEYPLEFKAYNQAAADDMNVSLGAYFNLQRNDCYKYVVKKGHRDITAVVEVVPYWGVSLNPVFGFDEI